MLATFISLFYFHQISSETDRRLSFFLKTYLMWKKEHRSRGPPEKGSSLTLIIESILWKNVRFIYLFIFFIQYVSGAAKARLSLRCELWSAYGESGFRVPYSKSPRWQSAHLSPSFFAVSRLLRSQGGCLPVYANSNLNECLKFYFRMTHESDFIEKKVDQSYL